MVDLPVSNAKGRNYDSTFNVCKCKIAQEFNSKVSKILIKESNYISVLSQNKRSASQAQSIVISESLDQKKNAAQQRDKKPLK